MRTSRVTRVPVAILASLLATSCIIEEDYEEWRAERCARGEYDMCRYDGFEVYQFYEGRTQGELNCDLHWSLSGTSWPSDQAPCPDCLFAFQIDAVYAPNMSEDDGTCAGWGTDSSFGYGLLLDFNYQGQTGDWLLYYASTNHSWAPFTQVEFKADMGRLTYSSGYKDEAAMGAYTTDYWYGAATLE